MAFVERVMQWGDDESDTEPPGFEPQSRHLAVHSVWAGFQEIIDGRITVAQFKSAINSTIAGNVDIDAIVAGAPGGAGARALYNASIHSVFILAEDRSNQYATPADVRSKLGI